MQSSGKQFLCGQSGDIKVDIWLESNQIMCVNDGIGPYTGSNVYNERSSEIGVKLIKHKLNQWIIKGMR